ncbi:MAG: methyltransferase domain-containing protein [Spirosomataceae bacterium]
MTSDTSLDQQYWDNRYQASQTGWDIGYVSPPLKAYFDQLTDKHQPILIPGCGNAYEAMYLLQQGFTNLTLVDISPTLVDNLRSLLTTYLSSGLRIECQDFFEHTGSYALIVEQTFFCALDPSYRSAYVQKMHQLLQPQGKLVGLLFDKAFEGGPPFGGNKAEYEALFGPYFEMKTMAKAYNSIPPRAGAELFCIFQKTNG